MTNLPHPPLTIPYPPLTHLSPNSHPTLIHLLPISRSPLTYPSLTSHPFVTHFSTISYPFYIHLSQLHGPIHRGPEQGSWLGFRLPSLPPPPEFENVKRNRQSITCSPPGFKITTVLFLCCSPLANCIEYVPIFYNFDKTPCSK